MTRRRPAKSIALRPRGFTLPEVIVSLIIFAIMMTSMTMAIDASLKGERSNREVSRLDQTIRTLSEIISRESRTCATTWVDGSRLWFYFNATGEYSSWRILSGQLVNERGTYTNFPSTTVYAIATGDSVSISSFTPTVDYVTVGGSSVPGMVSVIWAIRSGDSTQTITTSAMVRGTWVVR